MDVDRREGGEIEGTLISISCDFASGGDGWVVKWVSATHQSLMRLPSKRPTESIDMKAPWWVLETCKRRACEGTVGRGCTCDLCERMSNKLLVAK